MGSYPKDLESPNLLHTNMVQAALGSKLASDTLLHSYKSFNGFVANLTEKEAEKMRGLDGVVSVIPNSVHQPQTTKSWDFLGFPENVQRAALESELVVGVVDTGICPRLLALMM
ncbi:hypothetical protein RJT34_11624 [Clitoria ternatea]|uniref:Inhibitor I9 domain-containing protein n=1 Tax=Clitoria ternatea TaxID=43366 RepID=A0AAN9JNX9_CLITE